MAAWPRSPPRPITKRLSPRRDGVLTVLVLFGRRNRRWRLNGDDERRQGAPASICRRPFGPRLMKLQVPHLPVADAFVPLVGTGNLVLDASDDGMHEFGAPSLCVRWFEEHARGTPRQDGGHEQVNTLRSRHPENNIVRWARDLAGRGHQVGKPGHYETVRSAETIESADLGVEGIGKGGSNPDAGKYRYRLGASIVPVDPFEIESQRKTGVALLGDERRCGAVVKT